MQQIAFGFLEMSNNDFWNSTPREFFNRLHGFSEKERNHLDVELMRTKMLMYWELMNNPYIDKKDKPKSFEEFLKEFEPKKEVKKEKISSQSALFAMMGIKDD